MADSVTKAEAVDENARLRALLEKNGIDPDAEVDENAGIVGNLADLQRLGKLAVSAAKTSIDDAVTVPPVNVEGEHLADPETVSGKLAAESF